VSNKEEGIEVDPGGTVRLSLSSKEVVIEVPGGEGGRFVAALMQAWNMLEYWHRKKAAFLRRLLHKMLSSNLSRIHPYRYCLIMKKAHNHAPILICGIVTNL